MNSSLAVRSAAFAFAILGLWIDGARAQGRVVVPSFAADSEQAGAIALPGLGASGRVQFVIDGAALASVVGRNLLGIEFRRDTTNLRDHDPGSATVVVRIGPATRPAFGAVADFAGNVAQPVEVHRGPLAAPGSSVAGYVGWVDPHVLRIPFAQAYAYAGGALAVEIEASTVAAAWWPVDAAATNPGGSALMAGTACGPQADDGGSSLSIATSSLVAGASVRLTSFTASGAAGLMLVGLDTLPSGIPLDAIGAPGCFLHVNPLAVMPPVMSRLDARFGGLHEFHLAIPADPAFAAAGFAVQGLEFGAAGLATSEAIACRIASSVPSLGVAAVWAIGNGTPYVSHELVPVIGILHD
ncbi:MAG: hypothetical protein HZB39_16665 [Planctomycetes bacterium]|nr:hypothetical protein [Planctomycetota bacterium]